MAMSINTYTGLGMKDGIPLFLLVSILLFLAADVCRIGRWREGHGKVTICCVVFIYVFVSVPSHLDILQFTNEAHLTYLECHCVGTSSA